MSAVADSRHVMEAKLKEERRRLNHGNHSSKSLV